jgi:hypothetical protein
MKKYSALFLLCTLTFTACKKEGGKAQSNDEKYESKLPNYGSVNLKVFSPEDSKLADRNATVQAIDAYYKHVWEKEILVAVF